jgi:aminopeptidase
MSDNNSLIEKFALLLTDYCIGVKKLMEVIVNTEPPAKPLADEVYKKVVDRGGFPRILYSDPYLTEYFFRKAPEDLLDYKSDIDKYIMEKVDARIRILAPMHTKPLSGIDPERIRRRAVANKELSDIMLKRDAEGSLKWVVTAFPTNAMAQEAGFSPMEWEDFVYRSMKLYSSNPIEEWVKQTKTQEKIIAALSKIDEFHIIGESTDLTLKTGGRIWLNDDGKNNMPGGEVFTAPHEDSVEGVVRFTYPAIWHGVEVEGVTLKFSKGRVVEAKAEKGEEFLKKMLDADEGARRLGEFAFGLNYDITRFTKEILFDEKIGGTIHMALGAAYPRSGGKNTSSIHWDMIKDMREGKIFGDGDLIYANGKFVEEILGR